MSRLETRELRPWGATAGPVVLLVLAALLGGGGVEAVSADAGLRFGWRDGDRAVVTQRTLKGGRSALTRFRLRVSSDGKDGLMVTFDDFQFLELNGQPLTSPAARDALGPVLAMASAMPDLLVDADGALSRVLGVEELAGALAPSAGRGAAHEGPVRAMLASPHMQKAVQARVTSYWNSWVGLWVGLPLAPDGVFRDTREVLLAGEHALHPIEVRHHGAAPECPGCIRLTFHSVVEGPEYRAMLSGLLRALARQSPEAGAASVDELFEVVRRATLVEAVTDAGNLLPHRVVVDSRLTVKLKGEAPAERQDREEFLFGWASTVP